MSKKCTLLWREAHFDVNMLKALGVRTTFGGSDVASCGRRKGFCTLSKVSKTWGFWNIFNYNHHYTTLHSNTLHYNYTFTTFYYTTLHNTTTTTTQLHYITLHYTTRPSTTLHYTTLHYTTATTTTTLHYTKLHYTTSSTAQGGGGSFKNRKHIGEVGCCESGMAERIHWWTERCLRSPTLSRSFSDYLPTYLSSMYLSIYLSIYLSVECSCRCCVVECSYVVVVVFVV